MIMLRDVADGDVPVFYDHMQDKDAVWMAAFTPEDPSDSEAHAAHWARIRGADAIVIRTVLVDGAVAGHIASWPDEGARELTYWIGREHWGKGVATEALRLYVAEIPERPLRARAAADNVASVRVLAKCGFRQVGEERGFAQARNAEIPEVVYELASR